MAKERKFIGEYLVKEGIITEEQLRQALAEQKKTNRKVGEVLVRRGFASEEDIARALSKQIDFAYVDLATYQVEAGVLSIVPAPEARRLEVMPLFKVGDSLSVAMSNPLDVNAIDELTQLSNGLRIKPLLATPTGIKQAIDLYYGKTGQAFVDRESDGAHTVQIQPSSDIDASQLLRAAEDAPVVKLVNKLIEDSVQAGASDIHLEPQEDGFYCRMRLDGILHEIDSLPEKLRLAIISRIKIMANMDIAQNRLPQDGRVQTRVHGKEVDLRVATFPTLHGEHLAIRILDKTRGLYQLDDLGFADKTLATFKDIIKKPHGMILVTGPTGSGKSTTLYAALHTINDLQKNIVTLEDPVEYTIPRVNQSQVNVRAGLTFASGLRALVRLDPDIIMIGEIRDRETADIAIHAALTGHLMFSTLHTNDAASAATRLIDIGIEPYLVASSLVGILAQRLVRKLCPKCKEEYMPSQDERAVIRSLVGSDEPPKKLCRAKGCKACFNTGFKGRAGIFELLVPPNEIKELITKKAPAYEIIRAAQAHGLVTLRDDGWAKVKQGVTSLGELLRTTEEA